MSLWLFFNRLNVPFSLFCVGHSGLALMSVINLSLFYRVLKSDVLARK